MKNLAKKLSLGAMAAVLSLTFAACATGEGTKNPDTGNNNQVTESLAEKQVKRAKQTYESFYNKEGGLFTAQSSAKSAVKTSAVKAGVVFADDSASFDTVRNTLEKYPVGNTPNIKGVFNSYVADIFSYSQVQTSIINQFKESSLTDVYALTYENVDWSSDTTGNAYWINSTKLLSAAFAGTNLENGNVYCTQAHISNGNLVLANLEYFYNSDGDMGVTTLNWHANGKFEYHYCSAGTYEILQVFGNCDDEGNITLTSFSAMCQSGTRVFSAVAEADKKVVYDYVLSEVARINGEIDALQKQNGRKNVLDGTENADGGNIGVCSVNLDFSLLAKMLIK